MTLLHTRWRGDSSSYQNLCGQDALSGALSFIQVRVLVVSRKYIIRLDYVHLEDYYIVLELEQFNNIIARHTSRAAILTVCQHQWAKPHRRRIGTFRCFN